MVGMNQRSDFYIDIKRNHGQLKGTDRDVTADIADRINDRGEKNQFNQGVKKSKQILANIKIAAAGKNERTDGGDDLAFEFKPAFFTCEFSINKGAGAAGAKMDSSGQLNFGTGEWQPGLQQRSDFFSFEYGDALEFLNFFARPGKLSDQISPL